jgi:3-hydroxyacyl-[acyl-carrier-protein] dehydratase
MEADKQLIASVLAAVPQQPPFRFIDDILSVDENHIVGTCRFREDADFYRGHFPGRPLTPGVILLEALAQTGVVAFGIYLVMKTGAMTKEEMQRYFTLFTFMESVEFTGLVKPGERVIVRGEKIYFRKLNIKVRATMERENGEPICSGMIAGMAVRMEE